MDLKDLVISTLAEIEDVVNEGAKEKKHIIESPFFIESEPIKTKSANTEPAISTINTQSNNFQGYEITSASNKHDNGADLEKFLLNLKERILVLFEGLQTIDSSSNKELLMAEKKMDLTVNFLEYLLASIDEKLEHPSR